VKIVKIVAKVFKSFKILVTESYLLHMTIKQTWTWN